MLAASIHEHAGLGNQIWRYVCCRVGKFSGSTFGDKHFIETTGGNLDSIKNIVEVGGGYGGLCLMILRSS